MGYHLRCRWHLTGQGAERKAEQVPVYSKRKLCTSQLSPGRREPSRTSRGYVVSLGLDRDDVLLSVTQERSCRGLDFIPVLPS